MGSSGSGSGRPLGFDGAKPRELGVQALDLLLEPLVLGLELLELRIGHLKLRDRLAQTLDLALQAAVLFFKPLQLRIRHGLDGLKL